LFHLKGDRAGAQISPQNSIEPQDYATMPLVVASRGNRLPNEFFLDVLEDLHTGQALDRGPSPILTLMTLPYVGNA
jgi:hypothetical protein